MLTETYIEALLTNQELADLVWEAWDGGLIPDDLAARAWFMIARHFSFSNGGYDE